jgi:hypothetical protein
MKTYVPLSPPLICTDYVLIVRAADSQKAFSNLSNYNKPHRGRTLREPKHLHTKSSTFQRMLLH